MATKDKDDRQPTALDVVALLDARPKDKLARGQVGTVVEKLGDTDLLVEFSDEDGRAYAIVPVPVSKLMLLHYVPDAA
jgi:hypothetical protein